MATARTTKRPTETTTLETDENTIAKVTEIQDKTGIKKTIHYEAKVKPNDITENDEDTESEILLDDIQGFVQTNYQEIPKDKLDVMFEDIRDEIDNPNTILYAKLTRLPDAMTDIFNSPCNAEMPLDVFQFSLQDRFSFISAIQKKNTNSGGRFNISIFTMNQEPLTKFVSYRYDTRHGRVPITTQIGCINLLVPNPPKIEQTENANNNQFSLMQMFAQMDERNAQRQKESEERTEKLLMQLREKSAFEKAIEQKMMNDILNPPKNENAFENTFAQMMLMPTMIEKMSQRMFPETPTEREPTTLETIQNIASTPLVSSLFDKIADIAEAIAVTKLQQQAAIQNPNAIAPQNTNQLQQIQQEENEEMSEQQELINDIITELESDNVLDANNTFLQQLKEDFPNEAGKLINYCKSFDFDVILKLLLAETQNLQPYPFIPFLDTEKTNQENGFVWNGRGEKLINRLKEFYEVVKTI